MAGRSCASRLVLLLAARTEQPQPRASGKERRFQRWREQRSRFVPQDHIPSVYKFDGQSLACRFNVAWIGRLAIGWRHQPELRPHEGLGPFGVQRRMVGRFSLPQPSDQRAALLIAKVPSTTTLCEAHLLIPLQAVPIPPALTPFLTALAALGWVGRRRRAV